MKQSTLRLAATGARIATGAVVAAACVLGVGVAVAAPWPAIETESAATTVRPVPGDTTLVCNGSFRALGRDSSRADLMVSAATPRLSVGADDDASSAEPLEMPDVIGGAGAQTITGHVKDREVPLISASESVRIAQDDLYGFAAAPCRPAGQHTWLVGGDVSIGASDIILLSNPGSVPATVDLNIYGLQRSASTTIVPPRTQLGVPLASVSGGEQRPVVEVVSTGAPVRATLQSALIRTLDPVGIDLQDGVSGPQTDVMLLGVRSTPVSTTDDASGVVVRMLAPDADAQATVRVRASGSEEIRDEYSVELLAATPVEIALSGLSAGAYDIEITGTEPIVAAAKQTVRDATRADFSWMLPAPELSGTTTFSVPSGAESTIHVRNMEPEPVTVALGGAEERMIEIPASSGAEVRLRPGSYTLESAAAVHAAISMQGASGQAVLAGWPLWAPAAAQRPIIVRH